MKTLKNRNLKTSKQINTIHCPKASNAEGKGSLANDIFSKNRTSIKSYTGYSPLKHKYFPDSASEQSVKFNLDYQFNTLRKETTNQYDDHNKIHLENTINDIKKNYRTISNELKKNEITQNRYSDQTNIRNLSVFNNSDLFNRVFKRFYNNDSISNVSAKLLNSSYLSRDSQYVFSNLTKLKNVTDNRLFDVKKINNLLTINKDNSSRMLTQDFINSKNLDWFFTDNRIKRVDSNTSTDVTNFLGRLVKEISAGQVHRSKRDYSVVRNLFSSLSNKGLLKKDILTQIYENRHYKLDHRTNDTQKSNILNDTVLNNILHNSVFSNALIKDVSSISKFGTSKSTFAFHEYLEQLNNPRYGFGMRHLNLSESNLMFETGAGTQHRLERIKSFLKRRDILKTSSGLGSNLHSLLYLNSGSATSLKNNLTKHSKHWLIQRFEDRYYKKGITNNLFSKGRFLNINKSNLKAMSFSGSIYKGKDSVYNPNDIGLNEILNNSDIFQNRNHLLNLLNIREQNISGLNIDGLNMTGLNLGGQSISSLFSSEYNSAYSSEKSSYWSAHPHMKYLDSVEYSSLVSEEYFNQGQRNIFNRMSSVYRDSQNHSLNSEKIRERMLRKYREAIIKRVVRSEMERKIVHNNRVQQKKISKVLIKKITNNKKVISSIKNNVLIHQLKRLFKSKYRNQLIKNMGTNQNVMNMQNNHSALSHLSSSQNLFDTSQWVKSEFSLKNEMGSEISSFNKKLNLKSHTKLNEIINKFLFTNRMMMNQNISNLLNEDNHLDNTSRAYFERSNILHFNNKDIFSNFDFNNYIDFINLKQSYDGKNAPNMLNSLSKNENKMNKEVNIYESLSRTKLLYQLKKNFNTNLLKSYKTGFLDRFVGAKNQIELFTNRMNYRTGINLLHHREDGDLLGSEGYLGGLHKYYALLNGTEGSGEHKLAAKIMKQKGSLLNFGRRLLHKGEPGRLGSKLSLVPKAHHRINNSENVYFEPDMVFPPKTNEFEEYQKITNVQKKKIETLEEEIVSIKNTKQKTVDVEEITEVVIEKINDWVLLERQRRGLI